MKGNAVYQPKLREEHVVLEIMQRLAFAGVKVRRIKERVPERGAGPKRFRGGASDPGIPDLVGWAPIPLFSDPTPNARPIPVYIEVKRPGGARRKMQTVFIEEAAYDGCIAFFAESWADVVKGFAAHGIDLSRKGGIDG